MHRLGDLEPGEAGRQAQLQQGGLTALDLQQVLNRHTDCVRDPSQDSRPRNSLAPLPLGDPIPADDAGPQRQLVLAQPGSFTGSTQRRWVERRTGQGHRASLGKRG